MRVTMVFLEIWRFAREWDQKVVCVWNFEFYIKIERSNIATNFLRHNSIPQKFADPPGVERVGVK